jgi:hypothetical protein
MFAFRAAGSSVEVREFTGVTWAELVESIVSEAISGDDSVKRPAWD